MIYEIKSKDNAHVKSAASLREAKYRKLTHRFLSEGKKAFEMALQSGLVKEVFTISKIDNLPSSVSQYVVPEDILMKLSQTPSPEGIVFVSEIPDYDLREDARKIVYLDHVSDPGNAGTIIRTALAFGYDEVIFSPGSTDPYGEKCIAASKGSVFLLPVAVKDIAEIEEGHTLIVSALSEKAVNIHDYRCDDPFILVLGNESHGVSEELLRKADAVVKIPISGIDSLNVAIAGGILMEILR